MSCHGTTRPSLRRKPSSATGEGDRLIHLEQRHPGVAGIVLEFAHHAVVAALDDFLADADVGKFFFPEHLYVCVHFGFSGLEKGVGARFAFIVVEGCIAVDTFPLFPEALGGGVVDVFGITDGLVAQCLPAGARCGGARRGIRGV